MMVCSVVLALALLKLVKLKNINVVISNIFFIL